MRLKHFLKLKEQTNQKTWIILMATQYNLPSILYRLHKDFEYDFKQRNKNRKNQILTFIMKTSSTI